MRLFVALDLPEAVKDDLLQLQIELMARVGQLASRCI